MLVEGPFSGLCAGPKDPVGGLEAATAAANPQSWLLGCLSYPIEYSERSAALGVDSSAVT